MGAALLDSWGLPSCPHAAISSSPLLSLMVHTRPALMSTDLRAAGRQDCEQRQEAWCWEHQRMLQIELCCVASGTSYIALAPGTK
jgi:hypothetical protein